MASLVQLSVVGDGVVGKTCLLHRYKDKEMNIDEYIPTIFDNYCATVIIDGHEYKLNLWDTAGQEEYARLRTLAYAQTDCFILCYSLESQASFSNITRTWLPELRHYKPNATIILVGTKKDLRTPQAENQELNILNQQFGVALAKRCKLAGYLECSALTGEGVDEVFEFAIQAFIKKQNKSSSPRWCVIL